MQSKKRVHTNHVAETTAVIRREWSAVAELGIVLGTGMGRLATAIEVEAEFEYASLPHFQKSTAIGHRGRLLCGRFQGRNVLAMDGRFHAYEGYNVDSIAYPVRVMAALGARTLIASNAAGALNPTFAVGDIMLLDDHINLLQASHSATPPGTFAAHAILGSRAALYDAGLLQLASEIALSNGIRTHRGVYIAVPGPTYETPAESRYLRAIGGDAVGMSTIPEALTAADREMRTLAFSVITNVCAAPTDGHDVISAADGSQANVSRLISEFVQRLPRD